MQANISYYKICLNRFNCSVRLAMCMDRTGGISSNVESQIPNTITSCGLTISTVGRGPGLSLKLKFQPITQLLITETIVATSYGDMLYALCNTES